MRFIRKLNNLRLTQSDIAMICENLTIGTRIDNVHEGETAALCSSFKNTLSQQLAEKLHQEEVALLKRQEFPVPKKRPSAIKSLVNYCTKQDKKQISELMLKVKEDIHSHLTVEDSKKSKKILDVLIEFEDIAYGSRLVDADKLTLLRKLDRELLALSQQSEEVFKFTHLESIVASIAMTAASLAGLSVKSVFTVLEQLFGKKLKISKIRKSKGFELMKRVNIRLWDVY